MKTFFYFLGICFFSILPLFSEVNRPEPIYNPLSDTKSPLSILSRLHPIVSGYVPVTFRSSLEGQWPSTEKIFFEDAGVQRCQENYDRFRERMTIDKKFLEERIPRLIHLIWLGSEPTQEVRMVIESWKKHHPNWEVRIWRDADIKNFIWTTAHSKDFYLNSRNWSEKSDILRFEILYQFGGIYADTDMICLKSLEDLVQSGISFFAGFESNRVKRMGRPLIGSALIGAAKSHPILYRCMDFSLTTEQAPNMRQYMRSGPGPITKACYESLENSDSEDVIIFPCSFFFPLHWEARLVSANELLSFIRPESFSVHLWEGSWYDSFGKATE